MGGCEARTRNFELICSGRWALASDWALADVAGSGLAEAMVSERLYMPSTKPWAPIPQKASSAHVSFFWFLRGQQLPGPEPELTTDEKFQEAERWPPEGISIRW